jgi:hypothetical protein
MILREMNKPGFDSWHNQKFPTPKRLDSYLGPFIQGLQGSFLDNQVAWALGCRQKSRLLPMLRVSGAVPPFRQHFLVAWITQCAIYCAVQHTAVHLWGGVGEGSNWRQ